MTLAAIAFSLAVLAACVWFALYCLNELADARMLLYFTDEQWRAIICLMGPFGGAAFLVLEQAR